MNYEHPRPFIFMLCRHASYMRHGGRADLRANPKRGWLPPGADGRVRLYARNAPISHFHTASYLSIATFFGVEGVHCLNCISDMASIVKDGKRSMMKVA